MVTSPNAADNINNILNPTDPTRKSTKDAAALSSNLDDFLKLLTTQLQNQDPTNPMDTTAFTQQIASLSQVEQQINTNTHLEDLLGMFTSSQLSSAVGYIGKRVESAGNKSSLTNGQAMFVYNLPDADDKVAVTISDSSGNVVFSGTGDNQQGRNEVFWDGKNSFTGAQLPDGVYSIDVKATDSTGKAMTSTTSSTGIVTSVNMQDGAPVLAIGDYQIPLDQVLKISQDPLTAGAA